METPQVEEYLEAIYGLLEEGRKPRTTEIARKLGVKPASVTEMLKKLSKDKYITYRPYQGAELTQKGLKVGVKIKRKHRLLERFLSDILGLKKEKVHEEACRIEHALSDEAEDALGELMGHPERCPDDGKPIPGKTLKLGVKEKRLINLKRGDKAEIVKFMGGRNFQNNLRTMGLKEGVRIQLQAIQPLGGPVVVKAGNTTLALGRGMASKIIVKV